MFQTLSRVSPGPGRYCARPTKNSGPDSWKSLLADFSMFLWSYWLLLLKSYIYIAQTSFSRIHTSFLWPETSDFLSMFPSHLLLLPTPSSSSSWHTYYFLPCTLIHKPPAAHFYFSIHHPWEMPSFSPSGNSNILATRLTYSKYPYLL